MRCLIALPFLLLAASAADPEKAPTVAEELQRFQGTWQIDSWEEGGKKLAAAEREKRAVFFGANVFVFRRDGKLHQAGAATITPGKSPRTINFAVKEGEGKDSSFHGIYEFEGDTLRICFDPLGQERPEDFKPDAKAGFTLIALKRPKPAVAEEVNIVGKYQSELVEATGKVLTTTATVERRGDAYNVVYTKGDKVLFAGTALRRGDQLSMCWISSGQVGVSVYKIEAGPKLVGEYTMLGGIGVTAKEVLTPSRKD